MISYGALTSLELRRNRLSLFLIVVLISSVLFRLAPVAHGADSQWSKYSGNPIITPTANTWDADFVIQPRILYDGMFRMWYLGSNQKVVGIGYATSQDGVFWSKHLGPVLQTGPARAWDSAYVGLGSVIWNGSMFLMWYRGGNFSGPYLNGAVGLAFSSDGATWVKYSHNPILKPSSVDARFLSDPYVIKEPALYGMWYAARNSTDPASSSILRIQYATSLDGISWQKYPAVALVPSAGAWDSGSLYSPSAIFAGQFNGYGLWYTGMNASYIVPSIGYATSKDGISWTELPDNPILTHGPPGSWDSEGVEDQGVLLAKGTYWLYYDGISPNKGSNIGLAMPPQSFSIPEVPLQNVGLLYGVLMLAAVVMIGRKNKALKSVM